MAFENTIEKYGDEATIDMIIERTIDEYCDNVATAVNKIAFRRAAALTTVVLPSAVTIGENAFEDCGVLAKVDLTAVTNIAGAAFKNCSSLVALMLRNKEAACTLADANALTGTPIASGTGYIYIPSARYAEYASGTNWSTYSAQLRRLEAFTVDGTVNGELDETKI